MPKSVIKKLKMLLNGCIPAISEQKNLINKKNKLISKNSLINVPKAAYIKNIAVSQYTIEGRPALHKAGTVYYNEAAGEYQLRGIREQNLRLPLYEHTTYVNERLQLKLKKKNVIFLLFLTEFLGMVKEHEKKRLKMEYQATSPSVCATTIS